MINCHRFKALFFYSPTPKSYYLFLQPQSLNSFSTTSYSSDQNSSTISYLTKNCNLSPQDALKISKRIRINAPTTKPDSVISFFKNYGFSNTQLQTIILRAPELFVTNPNTNILPKFQFLSSKGASNSDIIAAVTRSPRFLRVSLEKQIIPSFDLVRSFCPSDKQAIDSVIACPTSISDFRMKPNLQFLLDFGVSSSSIYHLLRTRPSIICSSDLKIAVEEIKELGFDPKKICFGVALLTKKAVTKSQWDAKVNALKSWGCSDDEILNAFKKHPNFMLRSPDKLNAVMSFWVNEFGWDPSSLLAAPIIFGYSVEKRLIPRASVVKYLKSNGLIKKDASLLTPFALSEADFLKRYVKRFKEEKLIIKLYEGAC